MSKNNSRSHKAQQVIDRLGTKLNRQITGSMVACVHCGLCTESCHYVLANPGDPTYAPAYKADQIRKLFKRHYDWTGRVFPWWVKAKSVYTDQELEELKDIVFGKCTNCRRCSINCPMGVDLATFNRMARGLLVSVGIMPEGVAVVSKDQWETGNQMGVLKEDYLETLEWMEEELQDELDDPDVRIPIDQPDCDVVYSINPREVKYDPRTIADAAKIFHLAGEKWTMASEGWDMTNFGLFSGDDALGGSVARRLYEKVMELRGKNLVISECGHGMRSTRCEAPNWAKFDVPFEMESSIFTMLRYIKEGRIKVDKTRNSRPVTYHDSCNFARSCGIFEEPRELLRLVCTDFREMYPNRAENYCCTGGGGAMSMSEYTPERLKSGKIKADQLKASEAEIVVTSCHNCVDGLTDVIRHYELGMDVTQLVNLVANALVIEEKVVIPEEAVPVEVEALPLAGRTLLVADDEPDQVEFLATVFEDNGATVLRATNGDEALALARSEKPDLLTLDLGMPGRDVGEVYEILRTDPETADLKICIITGRPELRKLIYDRSVRRPEGYMDKPLTEDALLRGVRKVLELAHHDAQPYPMNDLYRQYFDAMPCYLTVQDRDLRLIDANQRYREDFGDIKDRFCYQVYKNRSEKCEVCPVEQVFRDGQCHRSEQRVTRLDGQEVRVLVEASPIRDESGEIVAVMEMSTDVTEIKDLERQLRRSQRHYRLLFDEVPCYISIQDPELNIVKCNRAFQEDFGSCLGRKCYEAYKHRTEPCVPCPVQDTLQDGQCHTTEELVTSLDGKHQNVLVTAAPIRDRRGRITGVMEMSANITQVRELESRLTSLGLLIGSVSHSLKGMLNGLAGGMYLVNTGLKKNDQERMLKGWSTVERNVARVQSMVSDILYYAKDRVPNWEHLSAVEVAKDVCGLTERRAQELNVRLSTTLDPAAGEFEADAQAVRSLLVNLLENSLDACRLDDRKTEHEVAVRLSGHPDYVEYEIQDNGIGMNQETQEKAFTLFFSSKGTGTGLGLFISDRITRAHGGTIELESRPGVGTRFLVKLPRKRPPGEEPQASLPSGMDTAHDSRCEDSPGGGR